MWWSCWTRLTATAHGDGGAKCHSNPTECHESLRAACDRGIRRFVSDYFCPACTIPDARARRTFTYERDVETAFVWRNIPRWNGEILVGYENNHSSGPVIYTIDRVGRRDEALFVLQDGSQINITDIAASSDGEIAIVGSAFTADTRGTTFLGRIATDRKQQTITRLWPYCPRVVTFAPDGTVWTIGNLKDFENTRDLARNVLRRFDRTGRMLGSRSLEVKGWQTAGTSFLSASQDRVGWFTRDGEYIEFSLDGSEIARYDGPDGLMQEISPAWY